MHVLLHVCGKTHKSMSPDFSSPMYWAWPYIGKTGIQPVENNGENGGRKS